ncbi:MAG: hypothetical protein OXN94_18440 [Chloroflexota bacterium]|nr:hypothetical protein [Chloroflexota bacterium]
MPERWDIVLRSDYALPANFVVEHRLEGCQPDRQSARLRVAELDDAGAVLDPFVPCQLERVTGQASAVFLLAGATAAAQARFFRIQLADNERTGDELIKLRQGLMHQEQESYQITTPSATYFYHILGAGFASMIDRDGKDWLSYRPFGGSDGKYRGIPNLAHPENHFHPGGEGCRSRILNQGPLKITIASESLDGKWACRWELYPTHARLTVLRVDHPYWFLYEGTPAGALDEESDYCVSSDGARRPLSQRWARPLPHPEWIYFGTSGLDRALFLAHHESDQHIDSYWPMEGNMTVFGFGRDGLTKFMTETPAQFTIGFAESSDFRVVQALIGALTQPESIAIAEN